MSWFNNLIPESVKKSVCSCLIKRYLSHFIENEITRDQLNLDLYNGRATAERISLAVEALNELSEAQNWPIEFVDGYIERIHISVPWTAIFKESTEVEICGLKITVQPKQTKEDATSVFESMWNSMTSSMHLAKEFAKEEASKAESNNAQTFEGIELFAKTIDTVVRRIKVKLTDTIFQIEHLPKESEKGVGLVFNIDFMEYFDDYSTETSDNQDTLDPSKEDSKKAYLIDSFTTKNVILKGIQLSTVEFSFTNRTVSRSLIREDSKDSSKDGESFFETDLKEADSDLEKTESIGDYEESRHVILCGKCYNNQEVKVRLKESENIHGPKVAIELNLGSLLLFLSPRQFHILLELVDGFSCPDLEDNSNVFHKNVAQPRPMTEKDYERVEEQLSKITSNRRFQAFNLLQGHGWSTGPMDESTDSEYLPMRAANSAMDESTMSGFSSSMDSSMTSSMVSSITDNTSHTRRQTTNIDVDPTAEISHFQVRIATLAAILLHEDLLGQTSGNEKVLVGQMQNLAKKFFDGVSQNTFMGVIADGFEQVHKSLNEACSMSHLRLLATPLKLEGNETTTSTAFSISGDLTASKLELIECLYTGCFKYIPLIRFQSPQSSAVPSAAKPNLALKCKHVQKTGKNMGLGKRGGPKTEVSVQLDKCLVEFDLSIVDRISCLIQHPPICVVGRKEANVWPVAGVGQNVACLGGSVVKSMQDFKVTCPELNFRVRFPIPDFRPATDMSKPPWWERNVRPDYLSLVLQNATFHTVFQTGQSFSEYNIECKLLDIFYYETENISGLHIARSGKELSSVKGDNSVLTKLAIKIYPKKIGEEEEDLVPDPMTHSFYGAFENQGNPEPGPFGGKKVVHESDTPHDKRRIDDSEEQVIPGDKAEVEDFVSSTTSNAQMMVEISLPMVSVHLESKHIYELIYNRITNDLLLWDSQAPKPAASKSPPYMQFNDLALDQQYIVANSGLHYESDSDSDEEEDTTNIFYSTYDHKSQKYTTKSTVAPRKRNGQSNFVLSLTVEQGTLTLNPPVRDGSSNVIPGQQGELLLNLNGTNVFIVNGYKGDKDLGYVCVQMNNAQLYHCDIQPTPSTALPLKEVGAILGSHLLPTVYQSEPKSLACSNSRGGDREMFTVALKIQANHETHHVKVITVSLGLNQATLKHKMGDYTNSWISHIIEFFNAQDYPIPGHVSKDVLTELHLHLWDCAIDYRPLHLPLRSVISIGKFSISSHLTAAANTSTLTLMFEDCGLFLSEKYPPKEGVASNVKLDLRRDFINVMEIDLFEISIKTTDKQSGINPHIDLRTAINMLRIKTCSDSGRALLQLLTYYINDGDIKPEPQPDSANSSPMRAMEEELLIMDQGETSNISKSKQDQISEMLEEAMEESPKSSKTERVYTASGAKLFYFPDEKEAVETPPTHTIPQVTADLGEIDPYHFGNKEDEGDDGFCFVGDDAMFPKNGIPEITWFSQDVKMVENHMAKPDGKRDLLVPPEAFPAPTSRYTLREMTIVWQMYGGNDFKGKEDSKKEVRFVEKQLHDRVSFSNTDQGKVTINRLNENRGNGLSWMEKGGVNRDHNVLMEIQLSKVKFSHEVYPETTMQASRQVLLISDVQIRDRLASSEINKFLYQYSSHKLPRQSRTNMVVIKALQARPDPKLKRQECELKISLLPIRLNIDQDSLFFLINFFKELAGESTHDASSESPKDSSHATPTHHPPIMTVSIDNEEVMTEQAKQAVNENLILLESRYHAEPEDGASEANSSRSLDDDSPIYFRRVEFSKEVLIRLDYMGKRVDMSHGPIAGLVMGLGQLKCSEIRLKRIVHRHGLLGFNKLVGFLLQEWVNDIKNNQLSNILGGMGPLKAVIQFFQGVKDLFWLPIEQYQKDGRVVRGLQRGANSFTTSTAMAALELTTRLIYLIQITAETAYDMLSPGPSIRTRRMAKRKGRKKRYQQPQDIREGLTNACMVVKEGIGETADNILQVATLEREQKGLIGAVGAVIRQIPSAVVKPVVIATEATENILGGMQSQLVPDARKEANEKWRGNS